MKRALSRTYFLLCQRYPDWSVLSVRKQFCLTFLKWAYTKKREDKFKVVELAKEFRKEPGRVGSHRTILEKKARKFFKEEKKIRSRAPQRKAASEFAKKLVAEKRGHNGKTPEQQKEVSEKGLAALREKGMDSAACDWIMYPPEGEPFRVRNMRKFCRENGLDQGHLSKTASLQRKHHKGWRAEKVCDEWDDLMDG